METRANYLMVGGFVLALMVGLLVFVVWLAKFQFDTVFARYNILFESSVTGLKEGSPVRYSGVRVGEVVEVGLAGKDHGKALVTIEVEKATPVRADTTATLELEGLTGGRYVLLQGGSADSARLPDDGRYNWPMIPSEASSLDQVLAGAPEVLEGINLLLLRANDLLNDQNRANVAEMISNLTLVSSTVAAHVDDIEALMDDASSTMANLNDMSDSLKVMAQSLNENSSIIVARADATLLSFKDMADTINGAVTDVSGDSRDLIKDLRGTAARLSSTSREMQDLIAENREPIRDFTATGLYELTGLITEARELIVEVNRVATEVQRDPARFLFGDQQQGYEADRK
jgi:phospholipid/cholesterol/gamma-HCH transport system substrate-binding protein